jgi:hypothetical protein
MNPREIAAINFDHFGPVVFLFGRVRRDIIRTAVYSFGGRASMWGGPEPGGPGAEIPPKPPFSKGGNS